MRTRHALLIALLSSFLLSGLSAQIPDEIRERMRGGRQDDGKKKDSIQPYDKVITKDAKTQVGLFLVHQLDEKIFYEIPRDQMGHPMLWVTQIAQTQAGHGYGGTPSGNRVIRWEIRDKQVLMRDVKFRIRGDGDDGISRAVAATTVEPIIKTFDIKAWGKDLAPVIDVTDVFTGDLDEFSAKRRLSASGADKSRTFVEKIRAFPTNIETKVLVTYRLGGGSSRMPGMPSPDPDPDPAPRRSPRGDRSGGQVTVLLHHSMVRLPDEPMTPREKDDRVGFFSVSFEDYGTDEHQVKDITYITRWRLDKKNPKDEISEPKKPIVFYVGRGVPEKWRPWIKKGIEKWQPAFEKAGFKNAIIAKDPPSEREDPDWDAEDARYSVIRWLPSTIENAMGPHVHDPRTGEILEADILVYHNILKLVRDWYFVQASPCDERAQQLPMPDDLIGELLAYVVAHEVGHSLGFPHNMKASSAFTVEQLRDPEFTGKWGTEASIMDYGRYNYVAQPGDGATLIPKLGPYDFFAVEWGYKPFSPKKEKEELAAIVARQVEDPMLRFGDGNPSEDPSAQTEDLGADPVEATRLGLKNIDRVASYLVKATCKEGEDYSLLRNMYDQLLGQRDRELAHVANVVGGMERETLWYGDADRIWFPVTRERQRDAVAFLNEHAFKTPMQLIDPDILLRLESNGAADRILRSQRRLLQSLLSERRIKRMAEHTERSPEDAYPPDQLLSELRDGIWGELDTVNPTIDLYRRNLQRAHVEILSDQVKMENASSDLPALCRDELRGLQQAIAAALPRLADAVSRMHLEDITARIAQALDPRGAPKAAPANPFGRLIPGGN